jgi:hypothetical protein
MRRGWAGENRERQRPGAAGDGRVRLGKAASRRCRGWAGEIGRGSVPALPGWAGEIGRGSVPALPGMGG